MTQRTLCVGIAVAGIASIVFAALELKKSQLHTAGLVNNVNATRALQSLRYATAQKHWPEPSAVATTLRRTPIQRGQNLIGWQSATIESAHNILALDLKDHNIAVDMYVNEYFYKVIPQSLGAPHRMDFTTATRRFSTKSATIFNIQTIGGLEDAFHTITSDTTPRTSQLLLTEGPPKACDHSYLYTSQQEPVLIHCPPPMHFDECKLLSSASIQFIIDSLVENFSVAVDHRLLLHFAIFPTGFFNCVAIEKVITPEPHEEPPYTPPQPLRKALPYIKRSRLPAPKLSEGFKAGFALAQETVKEFSKAEEMSVEYLGITRFDQPELQKLQCMTHHQGQRLVAKVLASRIEESVKTTFDEPEIPEATDYISHYDYTDARWCEYMRRQMIKVVEGPQWYAEHHPDLFAHYVSLAQEAECYWWAHLDEYRRDFPDSSSAEQDSSSNSGQSSSVGKGSQPSSVESISPPTLAFEKLAGRGHASVMNDPAIRHVAFKGPSGRSSSAESISPPSLALDESTGGGHAAVLNDPTITLAVFKAPSGRSSEMPGPLRLLPDIHNNAARAGHLNATLSQYQVGHGSRYFGETLQSPAALLVFPLHLDA